MLENFIKSLENRIPNKHELISVVSDTLRIERDSASRRLNSKVQFTVRELGLLASKLRISVDGLINEADDNIINIPLRLNKPRSLTSMGALANNIELFGQLYEDIGDNPIETGYIFDSIPMEFYMPYTHLEKFMYYMWMHYSVKAEEIRSFGSWELPERIFESTRNLKKHYPLYDSIFYVWDNSVIWNLANDLMYFYNIRLLTAAEVQLVRQDIYDMLSDLEEAAQGIKKDYMPSDKVDIYVSSIHFGITLKYNISPTVHWAYFKTFFTEAVFSDDESVRKMHEWMISMRNVSTLVSGSGEKERRGFFDTQRRIIGEVVTV